MGQGLIHQCEKGKPPAGVCYKDFFAEPNRLKTTIKIYEFVIRFLQGDFLKKNFSAREGVDGTSFGTLVQGGEALPLVYATKILLRNPGD